MSDQPETYQRVSVPEAAAVLGVSVATVRRRIRDGSLRAEPVHRPQGIAYAVLLPIDHATDHERSSTDQQVGATARLNQSPTPAADAVAAMIQATLTPIIAPLVAQLDAHRQTVERQAEEIATLREDRGRLTAELQAERAARAESVQEARTATIAAEPTTEPRYGRSARVWLTLAATWGVLLVVVWLVWGR